MTNQELERLQKGRELKMEVDTLNIEIEELQSVLNRTKEDKGYKLKLSVTLLDEYSTSIENIVIENKDNFIESIIQSKIDGLTKEKSQFEKQFEEL